MTCTARRPRTGCGSPRSNGGQKPFDWLRGTARSEAPVISIQILRVLSTIRRFDVPALLMGGQACVLYGAAEYSRDLDLAVLATDSALPKLAAAMHELSATVIAVPPFETQYLERGHAVHFSVPDADAPPLRVDIMSQMRGVAPFETLWERRTTVVLPDDVRSVDVEVELMALEDLVAAKKTQRDKDWPMLRRLIDASYDTSRGFEATTAQIEFRPTLYHKMLGVQLSAHGKRVRSGVGRQS